MLYYGALLQYVHVAHLHYTCTYILPRMCVCIYHYMCAWPRAPSGVVGGLASSELVRLQSVAPVDAERSIGGARTGKGEAAPSTRTTLRPGPLAEPGTGTATGLGTRLGPGQVDSVSSKPPRSCPSR